MIAYLSMRGETPCLCIVWRYLFERISLFFGEKRLSEVKFLMSGIISSEKSLSLWTWDFSVTYTISLIRFIWFDQFDLIKHLFLLVFVSFMLSL